MTASKSFSIAMASVVAAAASLLFVLSSTPSSSVAALETTTFVTSTTPFFATTTTTLGSTRISVGSVDGFLGSQQQLQRHADPVSSIFVANRYDDGGDDEASENMARYFFFNSNVGSFNTSVSFTIPLFSFTMPDFSGSLLNDLGINTLFSLACLGILFFGGLALLPFIFAYYGAGTLLPFLGGRSLDGGAGVPSWMPSMPSLDSYLPDTETTTAAAAAVESAVAKFAAAVGDQCAKRAVCEAHTAGRDANPLSPPIRSLFPVPDLEAGSYLEDIRLTPLQVAALYGRSRDADCGDQYRLCVFSLLDTSATVSRYLGRALDNYIRRK